MKALTWLALRQLRHHPVRNLLLVLCLALVVFITLVGAGLLKRYDRDLTTRATQTPLVLGQPGSRFDLCLGALFFRQAQLTPLAFDQFEPWSTRQDLLAVPLHLGYTAQQHPFVGTTPEYFEARGLTLASGRLPIWPGEVVLGAKLKGEHAPGSTIRSDPMDGMGLASQGTVNLKICGVLEPTQGPDDRALFGSLQTAWLLMGKLHGHDDARAISESDPGLVLAEKGEDVLLSGALVPDQEIENASRLHLHEDPQTLPLSAILLWPDSEKTATLVQTETNAKGPLRALRPTRVVQDLLAATLRYKTLVDRLIWIFGLGMALLFVMICVQSAQLRAQELSTLDRMGAPPGFTRRLLTLEAAIIGFAACLLATIAAGVALALGPGLLQVL